MRAGTCERRLEVMLYLTFWFHVLSLKESNRKESSAERVRGYNKGALKVQRIHCRDGEKEESSKGLPGCVKDPDDAGTWCQSALWCGLYKPQVLSPGWKEGS